MLQARAAVIPIVLFYAPKSDLALETVLVTELEAAIRTDH